jgi:putative hemolysin
MAFELVTIVVLVLANGFLAGAELAVVSVDRVRFSQLLERGGRRARALAVLRKHPERFFATVQVGITVVGATASAFGGATLAHELQGALVLVPALKPFAEELGLALVVAGISFLTIVLGELVPKTLALRYASGYALLASRPIRTLATLTRPIVWLLTRCSNAVLWLFGVKATFTESRLSTDELRNLVDEATEAGAIDPAAGAIAARALEFAELTAEDIMVPRARVIALHRTASPDEVRTVALEQGYSRLPVQGENIDDIKGYVLVKDMLAMAWDRRLIVLEDFIRPPLFVFERTKAPAVLQQMRDRRVHMAVVVDEHGGTSGIVTTEDLLEELVGEIFSETADEEEPLRRLPDGSLVIQADTPIRRLNRELDLDLPEDDGYSTLGGFCLALAGKVPEVGAALVTPRGARIEILEGNERAVVKVRFWPASEDTKSGDESLS